MSADPRPRPALVPADGTGPSRPAPARFTDLSAELPPSPTKRKGKDEHAHREAEPAGRKGSKDELVVLKVPLPKSVRRELRVRAEAAGYSPEELVYHLVRSWLQR